MKKLIIFLIAVIASSLILKPPDNPNPQLDSLITAFNNATHDTTKARLLVELTDVLYVSDPDTVIPLCKRALEVIDKNIAASNNEEIASFLKIKAAALNNIGAIYYNQGNPDKALEYYLQSLEIREEINYKQGIANSLNNIGVIYDDQGNPDKALEYYLQSLEIKEEINYKSGIATSLNNIGLIYKNQGNPDKALEYYLQSLEINKEITDKVGFCGVVGCIVEGGYEGVKLRVWVVWWL